MRTALLILALTGILVSSVSLSRHLSPNDDTSLTPTLWNSSAVNHSPYADVDGIPVAAIAIVGYALLGLLAYLRRRELSAVFSLLGLGYALYLTNIEAHVLEMWCVYCVASLVVITLTVFLAFAELLVHREPPQPSHPA